MSLECRNLILEKISDVNAGRDGGGKHWLPARQCEVGSGVIEFLRAVRGNALLQLVRVSIHTSRPMKRQSCEYRNHGMVGVACKAAFRSKRKQHLRTKFAQVPGQVADYFIRILTMKLTVRIIKHDATIYFQNLACGSELLAPNGCELQIALCPAAIAGGLSRCET